jgi:phosphate starvation-inducible PhoH-like protein
VSSKRRARASNRSAYIKHEHLIEIEPFTNNQKKAVDAWNEGKHLFLSGSAGTGKTFLALHLGLTQALTKDADCDNVTIIRSIVPTRDIGFLPGDEEKKKLAYVRPYVGICSEICEDNSAWGKLTASKTINFESTSFIRGTTFDDTVLVVDECQNMSGHELDSVITRTGDRCRIIFCGDYYQSDFRNGRDKNGILEFMKIIETMKDFAVINFTWSDIIRSDFVREYIMSKEMMNIKF